MRHVLPVFLVLTAFTCAPVWAQSAVGPYFGANLGRANTLAGVAATFAVGQSPLAFSPSAEASIADGFSDWRLNADGLYRLGPREAFLAPYVGAGLTLGHREGHGTDPGVNAITGVRLNFGVLVPFAQSRLSIGSSTSVSVTGGFLIRVLSRK